MSGTAGGRRDWRNGFARGCWSCPPRIAGEEQLIFQVEQFPTGAMVQNMRLATEAMGLGSWVFCGFNPDVLMGAMPEITRGLGFHVEAPNPRRRSRPARLKYSASRA